MCSNWTINIHKGSFISNYIEFFIKNGSVCVCGRVGGTERAPTAGQFSSEIPGVATASVV
jgi:hypothetical protein